jgi:hypothetical protein
MFNALKNAIGLGKVSANEKDAVTRSPESYLPGKAGASPQSKVSEWAALEGLAYTEHGAGYTVDGMIQGKPYRLEQGKPSRDFIKGLELRARGVVGVREDVAVMIMTRSLKNQLEKSAFSLYTDTLHTQVNPHLPEEIRWLSMYEEVGWEALGKPFLDSYAILTDERSHAIGWLTQDLAAQLLTWPSGQPHVPMVLMVLRGKVYLRMQINPGDMATVEHATRVFTTACETAVLTLSTDLA